MVLTLAKVASINFSGVDVTGNVRVQGVHVGVLDDGDGLVLGGRHQCGKLWSYKL